MANTYSALFFHVIFSTKNREKAVRQDMEARVWAYLGGIARENDFTALSIGGTGNHVHLLLSLPPNLAISTAMQLLKGGSSAWIKDAFPKVPGIRHFAWQDGYAAFSVSKSQLDEVKIYIEGQRQHHRVKTFEEEYRAFLSKNHITKDEKYLWG